MYVIVYNRANSKVVLFFFFFFVLESQKLSGVRDFLFLKTLLVRDFPHSNQKVFTHFSRFYLFYGRRENSTIWLFFIN